jgi:DnaJ family protein C protein 2
LGSREDAVPYGREAILRLGGVAKVETKGGNDESAFDMNLVKIPEGITPKTLRTVNLYEILGFAEGLGDQADMEVIKKAYHKAVLMYHPDKAQFKDKDGKEDRSVFLKIQEAFNVLTDEKKRRAYDSQLPFDEAVPDEAITLKYLEKGEHKFFKLYGPVFKRNARFSTRKPVPELGDLETPMDKVYAFYDFWNKFESWRDFTGMGAEHKPDDAGSREEKRWMQQENKKLAVKLKTKEMNRLITLVQLSEKFDPRVVNDKAARKAAKDAAKNAKEADANRAKADQEGALAWIEGEETALKEAKSDSKAEREKLKKKTSAARNLLKKLLRATATLGLGDKGEYGIITEAELDTITTNATIVELGKMTDAMGGDAANKDNATFNKAGVTVVQSMLPVMADKQNWVEEDDRLVKDARKREAEDKNKSKRNLAPREWNDEMQGTLSDAVDRYPVGHQTRWAMITNYLNDRVKPEVSFQELEVQVAAYRFTCKDYK